MSDQTQPIATRPQQANPLSPDEALEMILTNQKVSYYASFDPSDPLAKSAAFAALSGESIEIKSQINRSISVWGYIVRPSDPRISSDGELQVYPVSLLLCSGGFIYRSGSRGVLQILRLLEAERGHKIWDPPENVVPTLRGLGQNKQWLYLSRVSPSKE